MEIGNMDGNDSKERGRNQKRKRDGKPFLFAREVNGGVSTVVCYLGSGFTFAHKEIIVRSIIT